MDFNLAFENLINSIIIHIEDNDNNCAVEIDDFNDGVLKLICQNQKIFVINKNTPLNQVWLSSPVSGAYHFNFYRNNWVTTKGEQLEDILFKDLAVITNIIFSK